MTSDEGAVVVIVNGSLLASVLPNRLKRFAAMLPGAGTPELLGLALLEASLTEVRARGAGDVTVPAAAGEIAVGDPAPPSVFEEGLVRVACLACMLCLLDLGVSSLPSKADAAALSALSLIHI